LIGEQTNVYSIVKLRRLYINLLKVALGATALGFMLLLLLAWVYPPYIPHTSIVVTLAMYLLVGLLCGISIAMQYVVGKDWLKYAREIEAELKNAEEIEQEITGQ
jgi:hypothetical protein